MKIEAEVTVPKAAPDKRRELVEGVEVLIMLSGTRISAGDWKITLEKVPKGKKREETK